MTNGALIDELKQGTAQACQRFTRDNQTLLKRLAAKPDDEVDVRQLIHEAKYPVGNADLLDWLMERGFLFIEAVDAWTHGAGDEHAVRVLTGLVDGAADYERSTKRDAQMIHEVEHGRARTITTF
jgi:hypothetical protein